MEIERHKAIELRRLASTFLISDGEIDRADAGDILLAYNIQFRLQRLIEEILDRSYQKYSFAQKACNLIWALPYQGMRHDKYYLDSREQYGRLLAIEAALPNGCKALPPPGCAPCSAIRPESPPTSRSWRTAGSISSAPRRCSISEWRGLQQVEMEDPAPQLGDGPAYRIVSQLSLPSMARPRCGSARQRRGQISARQGFIGKPKCAPTRR